MLNSNLTEEQKKVCGWKTKIIEPIATRFFEVHCLLILVLPPETNYQAHHIASEQKRRENIRAEFDHIVRLTPTLSEQESRSELSILTKSANYIDYLKDENQKLIELCQMKGIPVPNELVYKGPGVANE